MKALPTVLDVCCGARMFWFDAKDSRAVFMDKRSESLVADTREGRRHIIIKPDLIGDFKEIPFPDEAFSLVIFDPPHLTRSGGKSWMAKKYGRLTKDWREEISLGFSECFRVLKPDGTLVFKWNELDIPVSQILALTPERPLIGNRCGKTAKTHWIVFIKSRKLTADN